MPTTPTAPYGIILLGSKVLNAGITTVQPIFTVPGNTSMVVTTLVFRSAAHQINVATTFSAGFDAAASDWGGLGQAEMQGFGATPDLVIQVTCAYTSRTFAVYTKIGLGGRTFSIAFADTLSGNSQITVDVLGYLAA